MEEVKKVLPMTPEPTTPAKDDKEALYMALQATFIVATRILAIRFFLFLSLVGSFVLSIIATNNQYPASAWVLILYALVTTLPLTVLEINGRRKGG